jgi:transposase
MADEKTQEFEERRRKGIRMLKCGVSPAEVARAVKFSRQTTSRWARILAENPDSWLEKKRGRPPGLDEQQLRQLEKLIRCRPLGGRISAPWTVVLVSELIAREFGVQYKVANVRRILTNIGLYRSRDMYIGRPLER